MSFYTQFAETYESIFPFSEAVYGFLRRYLPAPPASVLDVGCGTGHYTGALAADGYDAVGIDLDAAMIAHARAHYSTARFHVMDMLDIADLDHPFDGLACIGNTAAHLTQAQFSALCRRRGRGQGTRRPMDPAGDELGLRPDPGQRYLARD